AIDASTAAPPVDDHATPPDPAAHPPAVLPPTPQPWALRVPDAAVALRRSPHALGRGDRVGGPVRRRRRRGDHVEVRRAGGGHGDLARRYARPAAAARRGGGGPASPDLSRTRLADCGGDRLEPGLAATEGRHLRLGDADGGLGSLVAETPAVRDPAPGGPRPTSAESRLKQAGRRRATPRARLGPTAAQTGR